MFVGSQRVREWPGVNGRPQEEEECCTVGGGGTQARREDRKFKSLLAQERLRAPEAMKLNSPSAGEKGSMKPQGNRVNVDPQEREYMGFKKFLGKK